MNKLFPLLILNESIKSVKDGKTTLTFNPSSMSAVDDDAVAIIDNFLEEFDQDIFSLLGLENIFVPSRLVFLE